jgi:hypothetical protein
VRASLAGIMTACVLLLGAAGSVAFAETALLHPAKDSTLFEHPSGALASGSGPAVFAGRINSLSQSLRRGLILFDVASAVPPGSAITSARLSLNLSSTSAGPVTVRLHRVLAAWGEGASSSSGGGGATALPGDSTWLHRFYDQVFWTSAGGDFDPAPRAQTLVDQPALYTWEPSPELTADVQAWLDDPDGNHGWILIGDESLPQTVKRFDSREHPEEANRPLLEVDYVPPCDPAPLGPGSWRRQCAAQEVPASVLACADGALSGLGLPEIDPCAAVLFETPRDCRQRALGKLSVLVLNLCAGLVQTSCPVAPDEGACESTSVGELLGEIALLILEGDCRRASGCAGVLP